MAKQSKQTKEVAFCPLHLFGHDAFVKHTFFRTLREKYHMIESDAVPIFDRMLKSGHIVAGELVGTPGIQSYRIGAQTAVLLAVPVAQKIM